MRTIPGAGRATRLLRWTLLSLGFLLGTGCATLRSTFAGYATGRAGIARPQQQQREAMVEGDFARVLGWHDDDALLQALTTGVAAYYAKQFARSAAVLDTAALRADDRITASLTKDGLSLVTNDMARPYQTRRTERLFIPYYAMLSYVQLGAWEDAAVEARRVVGLVAQYGEDRDDAERAVHGAMQHLAGAVFERAGEQNDAEVAYRAAHAILASLPETVARGTIADEGELLVVVERGFVAHRATETIELFLDDADRDSLRHDGSRRRTAERIAGGVEYDARPGGSSSGSATARAQRYEPMTFAPQRRHHHDDGEDGYHLTIAYPSLRHSLSPRGGSVRLAVDGTAVAGLGAEADLDDASAVDARRERVGIAARAVARAAAKYAVTKAVTDKKGEVAGKIANLGASLLERADVRSWHLLPREVALVRVRVPAGRRYVRVQVGEGPTARSVDVGSVVVRRGELTILPVRLWRDPPPGPVAELSPSVSADAAGCATFFCP